MGTTLDQISAYLDQRNLKYRKQPDKSRILIEVELEQDLERENGLLIVIQLDEDGRFFKLFAPEVLSGVQEHPYKGAILQTMLSISWETKMLQWEYDPFDGEIRAIIEFPLEDSTLTAQQFYRCYKGLVEIVGSWALPRLNEVMQTGIDPGDVDLMLGSRVSLGLQEDFPGLLTQILGEAPRGRDRLDRDASLSAASDVAEDTEE